MVAAKTDGIGLPDGGTESGPGNGDGTENEHPPPSRFRFRLGGG